MTCAGCGQDFEGLAIGLLLSGDHDPETWIYLDANHSLCLGEWDIVLDPDGTLHHTHTEEADEDIRAS